MPAMKNLNSETAKKFAKWFLSIVLVLVGSIIGACGIYLFLIPYTISPGGVNGLSIIIEKVAGIPVYIMNLVINIPLFIFGAKLLGKKTAVLTIISTLTFSVVLKVMPMLLPSGIDLGTGDPVMLASIFGGITLGLGLGIVFKAGGTTGGTDLIGAIINYHLPGLTIAKGMAAVDLMIVLFSGIVTRVPYTSLYSLIALFFCMRIPDMIMDGFDHFKGFFIISNNPEDIGQRLMSELGRGVTILRGAGMYSKQEKPILLCVVSRAQLNAAREIVTKVDENAFIMIAEMKEVFGQGFKLPNKEK
ncbi:MAG: hypothetical protein CR988_03045 [Treponema sp.]|nr:MAG: hypothetical protein CR988_03045 [Treponema sp.]